MPLADRLRALAAAETLLVALDFDGTLAPLVDRPMDARPAPGAIAALRDLAGIPRTAVAFVTGREVDVLRQLADLAPEDPFWIVGSHGAEYARPGADSGTTALSAAATATLLAVTSELESIAAQTPGATIEYKRFATAIHLLHADPADAATATERLAATVSTWPGVYPSPGRAVFEFSVVDATKGGALRRLATDTGSTATLFAGDDITDETALRLIPDPLPGLGIKIGSNPSIAAERLSDPAAMVQLLEALQLARRAG